MSEEINVTAAESDWTSVGDYVLINDRRRGGNTYYRVARMQDRRTAVMVLAPWYMRALFHLRNLFQRLSAGTVFTRRRRGAARGSPGGCQRP